jgi:predicted transcriptional regulator
LQYILEWELELLNAPISDLFKELGNRPAPKSCHENSTFAEVIQLFAETKVHRIYVVDQDKRIKDVITLTNVLETIYSYCDPNAHPPVVSV